MANFDTIKTTIDANINTNGNQAITGAVMNSVLKQMVDSTDTELTELDKRIESLSGELLDKSLLFVNVGFVDLNGEVDSNTNFRYTSPILVKKGDIFHIHTESEIFYVLISTFSLYADSSMQNVIELSTNNGNKKDNAFVCSDDGYLVISMKYDFVLEDTDKAYLYKSTILNDSQLVDNNAKSFLVGKIARSFTHRKTLYGSAIRTDVLGYIARNGDLVSISDWKNSVLLFNVENLRGRYINIFQYVNAGVAAIPICFYNSATTFDNTTKISLFETEYGYKQNEDCGYVIRIPGNAKTFAISVLYSDKAQWNEYYGCRIFSLVENDIDNDYPKFLDSNEIICWGDSLTAGLAGDVPYENRWTTVLASLCPKYTVINAGVGGEKVQDIMARNGARPFVVSSKITLPADTSQISLGANVTNFHGETIRLLRQGEGAGIDSVNPVSVNGVQCTLSLTNGTYYLNRVNAGTEQMNIQPFEPFQTSAGKSKRRPYGAIFWMGTNNLLEGNIPSLDYFTTAYKEIVDYTGTQNYIIIGLKEDSYIDSGLYISYEEYFARTYGQKFVNIRRYFCEQAWIDAGITLSPSDQERIAVGKIPIVFMVDGVHFTGIAQGLLGNLLYKRMEQLGYL